MAWNDPVLLRPGVGFGQEGDAREVSGGRASLAQQWEHSLLFLQCLQIGDEVGQFERMEQACKAGRHE